MQAIGIRIRQDADLVVAQAGKVFRAGIDTDGHGNVMHFLGGQNLAGIHFPGIEDLAAQGHHRLEFAIPRLFGGTTGGIPLHQKQFGAVGITAGTVGQLARQRRTGGDFLAGNLFGCPQPALCVIDKQLSQNLRHIGVLVQPQAEGVLDHTGNKRCGLAGGQALLGLAGELRLLHFERQHISTAFPDILRRQLDPPGHQITELAEFTHGFQQTGPQPVYVSTALGGGNQVHVAFHDRFAAFRQPLDRPVHRFLVAGEAAGERVQWHRLDIRQRRAQVIPQSILVAPLVLLAGFILQEGHRQPRAQHRFGAKVVAQTADREIGAVEVGRVRSELQPGTGVALAYGVDHRKFGGLVAVGEGHAVQLAVTLDGHLKVGRQCVDHRHPHPVQTAGTIVVALGELAACVQAGEDQLDTGQALFFVEIHRHAAAVILNTQGAVAVQHHIDPTGVAGKRFVNAVIDHFLRQVIGTAGVGVHTRAFTNRVQAAQDFNGVGVIVLLAHRKGQTPRICYKTGP